MSSAEIAIVGGGAIGLSLALALRRRGADVAVLTRDTPAGADANGTASWAAAGMLCAEDPSHPDALRPLVKASIGAYPEFLQSLHSAAAVLFETSAAYEETGAPKAATHPLASPGLRFIRLAEWSVDPRLLWRSLSLACRDAGVAIHSVEVNAVREHAHEVQVRHSAGHFRAARWVNCAGAWASALWAEELAPEAVVPRKGQMLRLKNTPGLREVIRSRHIYAVPRLDGTLLAGATVEACGFDRSVSAETTEWLRAQAARLVPTLAEAPLLDAWTGLRPGTPDDLPLLGQVSARGWAACGHFRNGILLAPGTAIAMADALEGKIPAIALDAFAPARFAAARR